MKAEAIATVSALRGRTRRNGPGNRVRWIVDHDAVPIHVATLLDELG